MWLLFRLAVIGHGLHAPVTARVGRCTARGGLDLSGNRAHGKHKRGHGQDGTDYVLHHPRSRRARPYLLNSLPNIFIDTRNPEKSTPIPSALWLELIVGFGIIWRVRE